MKIKHLIFIASCFLTTVAIFWCSGGDVMLYTHGPLKETDNDHRSDPVFHTKINWQHNHVLELVLHKKAGFKLAILGKKYFE